MTTIDKCREEFEHWHDCLFDVSASTAAKNKYGYPENGHIQMRWQAWQASRTTSLEQLEGAIKAACDEANTYPWLPYRKYYERQIKAALDYLGITVRGE
jgi:hypothetical protein